MGQTVRHNRSLTIMNILAILSVINLSLVWASSCPKYLSLTLNRVKYRLVADGTESGFKACHGDIANCVYTREMKFYCMSGDNMDYEPLEIEASYENLKENVTQTSFGKAGGEKFEIDLTGTNNAIRMTLYQKDVEGRTQCAGIKVEKCGNIYSFGEKNEIESTTNSYNRYGRGRETISPSAYFDLKPGYPITEVYGSRGLSGGDEVIDAIYIWIAGKGDNKITCGGGLGSGFDATPKASVYGPCYLIGVEATGKSFIQSLTLKWTCLGLPDFYF